MVFGYALAVIAGFLLTAVKTWTNQPMPYGWHLGAIFGAWAVSRFIWFGLHVTPSIALFMAAFVFDMIFWGMTAFAVIKAVWAVRQKRQIGIITKLLLLGLTQVAFYVGVLINHHNTQQIALYFALYLVIGVVFTIARRVLPFFITKGISVNHDGTQMACSLNKKLRSTGQAQFIWFFGLSFLICSSKQPMIAGVCALVCLMANLARLKTGITMPSGKSPCCGHSSLHFGMTISLAMFVLYPIATQLNWFSSVNIHTLGLHGLAGVWHWTDDDCHDGSGVAWTYWQKYPSAPATVSLMFMLMILCGIFRVVLPLFFNDSYMPLMLLSQVLWIASFVIFCLCYVGILVKPRTDGLLDSVNKHLDIHL